jgi:hypothetical protein
MARKGHIVTEETRSKLSEAHRGKKLSYETRMKLSQIRGEKHSMYGKHISEEHRIKIGNAHRGKKISEKQKSLMSEAHRGKKLSEEHKRKIGEAGIGHLVKEETRIKIGDSHRGEKSVRWLGGKSFEPYGIDFNNKLREQIRQRDNHECQECHLTQGQAGYKLPVHHINYNKKNNDYANLITLCKSCHSQTNFSRADWTGYFRKLINS